MEFKVTRELQYVDFDHELTDDELLHFKYIKKVRKNGKWRYYYDVKDAMGYDERERYLEADKKADEWKRKDSRNSKLVSEAQKNVDAIPRDKHGLIWPWNYNGEFERQNAAYKAKKASSDLLKYYSDQSEKLLKEYKRTPLYKIEKAKKAIDNGKRWLQWKLRIH